MTDDLLAAYTVTSFAAEGFVKDVYRSGEGPAVVVMAEIPGITPKVLEFAQRVIDRGFTVWIPQLFGTPGRDMSPGYVVSSIVPACVSKEFAAFATGRTEPISVYLRALARHAHAECGGPGVGAVGMCFTGGFALGMMVDDSVLAPVLSQPSLPIGVTRAAKASLHLSPEDRARVKERAAAGVCVLGLRFSGDAMSAPERFETLRRELGDAFIGVEIDSSPGNPGGNRRMAHSVLTEDLRADDPEHPTAKALAQVLDFFTERLQP